jgi:positive regulator of sigma E activity
MPDSLSPAEKQVLQESIIEINDTLQTFTINLTGQAFFNAFKLAFTILLVPLAIILLLTYLFRSVDFTTVFMYSCTTVMLAMAFASLVASRMRVISEKDNYQEDIGPKIQETLTTNGFTRRQFDIMADRILEKDAPLRQYIVLPKDE